MNLDDTIGICKAYARLGPAVQVQLDIVLAGDDEDRFYGLNINALAMIHEFLKKIAEEESRQDDEDEIEAWGVAQDILRYVEADGSPHTIRYGRIVNKIQPPEPIKRLS